VLLPEPGLELASEPGLEQELKPFELAQELASALAPVSEELFVLQPEPALEPELKQVYC
jgi:hypothetical protein